MTESNARAEADLLLASVDDPAAFRAFYDMWATSILGYFQRRVHDPDLALELTAETFAVAFEKRSRFRWMGKSPGAWLFGIATRILFRHLRQRDTEHRAVQRLGLQIPRPDEDAKERIEDLLDGDAVRAAVRAALADCRPGDRRILELHVIDGLPYPEVAATLGCTVNTARVRVHRALARLEGRLDLVGGDPGPDRGTDTAPVTGTPTGAGERDATRPDAHGVAAMPMGVLA